MLADQGGALMTVPWARKLGSVGRYRIRQNQRGLLLATVLRASTDAVICTIPYKLNTR